MAARRPGTGEVDQAAPRRSVLGLGAPAARIDDEVGQLVDQDLVDALDVPLEQARVELDAPLGQPGDTCPRL